MYNYDRRIADGSDATDAKTIQLALAAVTKASIPLDALAKRWGNEHAGPKNVRLLDDAVTGIIRVLGALYRLKLDLG